MSETLDATAETETPIETLPLDAWHRARGGRMVPFAGYAMPVQYEGIMAEHLWTREHAGLFDVSHMGQLLFTGDGAAEALEALLPGDIKGAFLADTDDTDFNAGKEVETDVLKDLLPARVGLGHAVHEIDKLVAGHWVIL